MKFIKCTDKPFLDNSKYGPRQNDPVNIEVIERISRGREHYYPDNEGIPVIEFFREGKKIYQWMFEKYEESVRDKVFEKLVLANSIKDGGK